MDILQIDKTNIKSIAALIEMNKAACNDLTTNFRGTLSHQEVDRSWNKFIIKSEGAIKAVLIDCRNSKVTAVTFSGLLDITYNDLVALFGVSTEYYERYDDTIEFLFTRDAIINNYSIKCFILRNEKQNINWQNEKLGNIAICLS